MSLLGRRHTLVARKCQGERLQLDGAKLDEIRPEAGTVGLLHPQRLIALNSRDEPVFDQHVAESTRQAPPLWPGQGGVETLDASGTYHYKRFRSRGGAVW